ncbi:MAG: glycosyltransferase family 39 protein [Chitinophagaceae bacterium]|nr:glycosyltransferase family 39 protein [Chitinophagaceae bacterium]
MNRQNTIRTIFCLILLLYSITELSFISSSDLTADEGVHHLYGVKILKGDPSKRSCTTDDSKMPVSALNALPRAVEQVLHPGLNKPDYGRDDTKKGRYITFIVSFFTLFLVFRWTSEWYGAHAGLFSMGLLAFCPGWLGHSGLVTTDAYSVTIFLLVVYCLWKYLTCYSWKCFLLFAVSLGIAQLVKQTFVHLYICIPLLLFVYAKVNKRKIHWRPVFIKLVALAFINLFIINAGFLFYKTGHTLQEYVFVSRMFQAFQQTFSFIGNMPLPLPEPYLSGMDTVKYFDELGGGFRDSTFSVVSILGHKQPGASYWYYYLVTLFYKIPIPVSLFFIWTLIKIFSGNNKSFFAKNEILLLAPVVYFLVVMSLLNNIQAGERHILFLYAGIFILCGKIVTNPLKRKHALLTGAGCAWMLISVFSYRNCFISYTNEFIHDKKFAYKKVGNANLDFGQGGTSALQYMKDHPDVLLIPPFPQKGKFILSVSNYENGFGAKELEWVQQYEPIDHVRHSHLLIEVK